MFRAITLKLSLPLADIFFLPFSSSNVHFNNCIHKFNTCLYEEYCNLVRLCKAWSVCAAVHVCYRENILSDCFQGCFIVTCTLCTFISLVWLREQILHGGGPDWLDQDPALANHRQVSPVLHVHGWCLQWNTE